MKVSVLIITYQRTHLLEKCLQSLRNQKSHHYTLETLIFINGKDELSTQLASKDPLTPYLVNSKERISAAKARNILLNKAAGEYILFLDDDVELPEDYLKTSQSFTSQGMACFGGPDILPRNPLIFQKILSTSQKLWMSSAHTRYRHGAKAKSSQVKPGGTGEELILCNMWVKKVIFEKFNIQFDPRFYRNEENILIHQLQEKNIECFFISELYVHHYKKDHLLAAIKAIHSSGYHRGLSFKYYPRSIRFVYFVPSLFILFLIASPLLPAHLVIGVIALYLTLGLLDSAVNFYSEGASIKVHIGAWAMQILTNIVYGLGLLRGLLSFFKRRTWPF